MKRCSLLPHCDSLSYALCVPFPLCSPWPLRVSPRHTGYGAVMKKELGPRAPVCGVEGSWGPRLGRAHLELDGEFVGAKCEAGGE